MRAIGSGGVVLSLVGALHFGCGGTGTNSGSAGSTTGGSSSTTTTTTSAGGTSTVGDGGGTTGGNGGTTSAGGTTSTGGTGSTTTTDTITTTPTGFEDAVVLVAHTFLMGDTTPQGQPSSTAWKQYGFNLDGKISDGSSVDLCKPAAGGKISAVYPDGLSGIDNSFGKNLMPIWTSLVSDYGQQVNATVAQGGDTMMIVVHGLGAGQLGLFYGAAYTGAMNGVIPAWQGNDVRPVSSDSVVGLDLTQAKAAFPGSTVTMDPSGKRIWDSGPNSNVDIDLILGAQGLMTPLPIRRARITMELSDDNKHVAFGMIGGILDTEKLVMNFTNAVGSIDPSLCPPSSTLEAIVQMVRQAQDILLDGTQDPTKTCNGISIGLGFTAEAAVLGDVYTPPVPPDPCAP